MKVCQYCNEAMHRPSHIGERRWATRKFCSESCSIRARSTPAYTDEPVPRGTLPDEPLEVRILFLLRGYYPVPLSGFDVIDVTGVRAPDVWAALASMEGSGIINRTSGNQFIPA